MNSAAEPTGAFSKEERLAMLRGLAAAGLTQAQAAERLGLSVAMVRYHVQRMPGNWRSFGAAGGSGRGAPDLDAVPADGDPCARRRIARVAAMPRGGMWTLDRDVAVFLTAGRYEDLAALAVRWHVRQQSVLARWHVLRVIA